MEITIQSLFQNDLGRVPTLFFYINTQKSFYIAMPAKSKSQQRFMGMVRAVQKGEMKSPSPEVAQAASSMTKTAARDFASTKHKKLPEKKNEGLTFQEFMAIIEAVDWSKSEPGKHTGDPVPIRKMSAANRHKFEQERRKNLSKKPGVPGDSPMIQALRKKAQDTGNYAEAKVDWQNRDKENVQDRINVLRDRNRRLESDHPEVASGKYQTDFRRKRHTDSRGKKRG